MLPTGRAALCTSMGSSMGMPMQDRPAVRSWPKPHSVELEAHSSMWEAAGTEDAPYSSLMVEVHALVREVPGRALRSARCRT